MPLNLFLLPLISGYYFTHHYIPRQVYSERLEGHRLIFDSTLFGLLFLFLSYTIVFLITKCWPSALYYWSLYVPYDKLGTAILSLLIGLISPHLLNRIVDKKKQAAKVISEIGTELEKLVLHAIHHTKLVSITLTNGKVYIGFMAKSLEPKQQKRFITILPTLSGYRDVETKKLHITTKYDEVYQKIAKGDIDIKGLDDSDFEIIIPVSEILTANIFNVELYKEFQKV